MANTGECRTGTAAACNVARMEMMIIEARFEQSWQSRLPWYLVPYLSYVGHNISKYFVSLYYYIKILAVIVER